MECGGVSCPGKVCQKYLPSKKLAQLGWLCWLYSDSSRWRRSGHNHKPSFLVDCGGNSRGPGTFRTSQKYQCLMGLCAGNTCQTYRIGHPSYSPKSPPSIRTDMCRPRSSDISCRHPPLYKRRGVSHRTFQELTARRVLPSRSSYQRDGADLHLD